MTAKTEEFLYLLLWGAESLLHPTFRNLNESYEAWAYRTGLRRQLARLEKSKFIERQSGPVADRIYRLTTLGRLAALGGRDPLPRWNRHWDERWRLVVFDLPEHENTSRVRLRRMLKKRHFGYLQNSLWITPDPLDEDLAELAGGGDNVESFLTLEARPCSGESDAAIVAGAWDFQTVNRRYQEYLSFLKGSAGRRGPGKESAKLQQLATRERVLWQRAIQFDPLLPTKLQPTGYRGPEAWRRREAFLRRAGPWLENLGH